jgi:tetratricopeptide (TPR) repeat protein
MSPEEFDLALPAIKKAMFDDKAPELMSQAIRQAQHMVYPLGLSKALLYRGEYLIDLGEQPAAAFKDFREAGLIARQLRDWTLLAQTLHWQAQSQLLQGEYMRALDVWLQALQTAIEAEDSRAFIRGYSGIAQVCLVFGQLDVSLEYQQRALVLANGIDDVVLNIDCTLALIATCYRLKRYDQMQPLLLSLKEKLMQRPHLETQAEFHIYTGLIYLDHDQLDEAHEHLQLARVLAQQLGGLWCRSFVALILGQIYIRQERLQEARLSLELCLHLGEQIRGFAMGKEAHQLLETLCVAQGDYEGALVHLDYAHKQQLNLFQRQAERKLTRVFQKPLNHIESALRIQLSRIRYGQVSS